MDIDDFIRRISNLSAADIAVLSAHVRSLVSDDDVEWWRATIAVDRSLRKRRRSSRSAAAAASAGRAVVAAARRAGLDPATEAVALLAAAAADTARALVAEDRGSEPCYFLEGWIGVLDVPSWAPCEQAA